MITAAILLGLAVMLWPSLGWPPVGGRGMGVSSPGVSGADEVALPSEDDREPSRPLTDREVADASVLLAVALRSGRGLVEAIDHVAAVASAGAAQDLRRVSAALQWGRSMAEAWEYARPPWSRTAVAFVVADRSGAAAAEVLLEAARLHRQESARDLEAAAERAGVMLVLPLGLCFLPAFIATAVVPLVGWLVMRQLG